MKIRLVHSRMHVQDTLLIGFVEPPRTLSYQSVRGMVEPVLYKRTTESEPYEYVSVAAEQVGERSYPEVEEPEPQLSAYRREVVTYFG